MKYIKDWKLFEELLYNDKSAKAEKGETLDFSNRLAYWNGLHKKFRNGDLTDDEKRDFRRLINAKNDWLDGLLSGEETSVKNKKEIIQRVKQFNKSYDNLKEGIIIIAKNNFKKMEQPMGAQRQHEYTKLLRYGDTGPDGT